MESSKYMGFRFIPVNQNSKHSEMEIDIWDTIDEISPSKSLRKITKATGIDPTRLWRVKNFGGMRVLEYEKLIEFISKTQVRATL